jgi:hypothetical protein
VKGDPPSHISHQNGAWSLLHQAPYNRQAVPQEARQVQGSFAIIVCCVNSITCLLQKVLHNPNVIGKVKGNPAKSIGRVYSGWILLYKVLH